VVEIVVENLATAPTLAAAAGTIEVPVLPQPQSEPVSVSIPVQ